MLLDRVTSELSMGQLHQGQSSLHGPHTSNNHAISLKVTSHTLPPRFHHSSVFPASQEAIEPLSITDILSDNDEDSERRSTLESPAAVDKRRNESANDLLCANQRMKGEEQTKTPRASVLKEDFEVTLHSSSPTSIELSLSLTVSVIRTLDEGGNGGHLSDVLILTIIVTYSPRSSDSP